MANGLFSPFRINHFFLARSSHDANIRQVNVITHKRLKEFNKQHADAAEPLDNWYRRARKARWQNLAEVKIDYPQADLVGKCTVFNISGNKYRLIVKIVYIAQAIYVKHILTHAAYNKGRWKNDC